MRFSDGHRPVARCPFSKGRRPDRTNDFTRIGVALSLDWWSEVLSCEHLLIQIFGDNYSTTAGLK